MTGTAISETTQRFIILSLTPVTGNLCMEGLLARVLRQAGCEVAVLRCNGVRERCTVGLVNQHLGARTALCLQCTQSSEGRLTEWAGESLPELLLDDWVDPVLLQEAYAQVDACPDDRLLDFVHDGMPLGQWTIAALRVECFGEDWQALPDLPGLTRQWLRSTLVVAQSMAAMLHEERPSAVIAISGLLPWERVVLELARRQGVRCIFYEGGQRPGSMILREGTEAGRFDFGPEWRQWADVPLSVDETARLDAYLNGRRQSGSDGLYVFSPAAVGDAAAVRQRLGLQPGRPVLLAFTSFVVDSSAFDAHTVFPSQAAWLDACVAYAQAHPQVDLVVRVHPGEAVFITTRRAEVHQARDRAGDSIRRRWPVLPPNVRIVASEDPTSSYDLLPLATVVLGYISTVCMEAAAAGLPVLSAARSHYSGIGFVWQADGSDDFVRSLTRLLAAPAPPPRAAEIARRYLYLWFFRCTPVLPGLPLDPQSMVAPPSGPLPYWDGPGDPADVARYAAYLTGSGPFADPPAPDRAREGGVPRPPSPSAGGNTVMEQRQDDVTNETRLSPVPELPGKFIILSFTPLSGNLTMEGLLARSLRQAGQDVAVMRCNGVRERCTVDLLHAPVASRTAMCLNCATGADGVFASWSGGGFPTLLLDEWVTPEALAAAEAHVAACPDDHLLDLMYDDLPVGRWVTSALRIEYFGEDWRSLPDLHGLARIWLRSSLAVAVALSAMLESERPTAVLVLGGLLPWERLAMALARRHGLRCLYYEGGQRPGSLILRDDTPACQYNFSPEWQAWADVPLSIAEASHLDGFLRRRQRVGKGMTYVFSPAASGDLDPIRRRLGLQAGRPTFVAFTSVVVDTISFEAQSAFPSQAAWLQACVAYAEAHPDIDLVIRVHPAEATSVTFRGPQLIEAHDQVAEVLQRRWSVLPPNVRLIPSGDPTSSYDLIAMATVVLNYISTVGLEAAAAGWPVVTAGLSHYSDVGIVWQATDPGQFCELLDRLSVTPAPPPDGTERARRYLYFWFFRCTPVMPGLPLAVFDIVGPPAGPLPYWEVPGSPGGLQAYTDFMTGRGPFVPAPAAGRPRDAGRPVPLRPPARSVLLLWPGGWTAEALAGQVVRPLQGWSHPWTIVVWPDAADWQAAATRLAAALAAAGATDLEVTFLAASVSDEERHHWLAVASAAAWPAGTAGPEDLMAAYGLPAWSRIAEEMEGACVSP